MATKFVCAVFVLLGIGDFAYGADCPDGFESHMNACYFFSHGKETWIAAFDSCKLFKAQLVEVDDLDEDTFLSNKSAANDVYYWIGLADKQVEGEYVWETSQTMLTSDLYSGWAATEPNGDDDENCVYYARSREYAWADGSCSRHQHYICEINNDEGGALIG